MCLPCAAGLVDQLLGLLGQMPRLQYLAEPDNVYQAVLGDWQGVVYYSFMTLTSLTSCRQEGRRLSSAGAPVESCLAAAPAQLAAPLCCCALWALVQGAQARGGAPSFVCFTACALCFSRC